MGSRTTIRLDDDLMRQLKERAKRQDVSLTRLFNDAIRQWLRTPSKQPKRKRFVQKTYDMGQPLIDLTHTNAVIDALEDEEIIRKMGLGK
jgi:predicted transcriptional regulator